MLTKQDIENVANLAKLEISDENASKILKDMTDIVNFVNKIGSADTSNVNFFYYDNLSNKFRPDDVVESSSQTDILKNCKTPEEGFFRVSLNG